MKQILQSYKSGELWLAEVPIPLCQGGGVLVKTCKSFVSAGTERMLVDFAKKNIIGKSLAMPDQVKKVIRKMKTEGVMRTVEKVRAKLVQPIPLGYSCAGIVEEVGTKLSGLSRGDRVACGGAGYANHAEYNYVPKNLLVKIPDNVSFEDASCTTVGSIALQGIRQCDLRLGESVCVMGLGMLGLIAVQIFKASGVRVIGYDPDPERCDLAISLGADLAVDKGIEPACIEFSEGHGVDAVHITAAAKSNEPVTVAGEICRMKGTVVVTGLVGMDIPRDMYYRKELNFKLSLSYGPGRYDPSYEISGNDYPYGYVRWTEQRNMKAFLALVAAGKVSPSKLITHRFGIEDALDAYGLMLGRTKTPYLGILLNYQDDALPGVAAEGLTEDHRLVRLKRRKTLDPSARIPVIGLIGAGNFSKGVLLPELKKQQNIQLKGICTATGMNASETGKKEGFDFATTDHTKIMEHSDINTVFISTRHDTHARFVCDAIRAGKHVFVEKPLCLNLQELDEITQVLFESTRQNAQGILMVGFNRRFSPHAQLISEYFRDRSTPMVMTYRINAGIIPSDVWIQDPEVGGGRIIGETCHFIDFASFVIGSKAVEVQALSVSTSNASLTAEDNISFNIKYEDGSIANIVYVAVGSPDLPKERCEIFADESVVVMEDFRHTLCRGRRGSQKLKAKQSKGFREEISAFLTSIEKAAPPPIPFESLINTTRCSFAVIQSLKSKQTVKIDK